MELLSSPLQGFTDYRFRNAFDHYFGGIDHFFAPYIRFNGKLEIKPAYDRDLQPGNNRVQHLCPQVMTNNADEFLFAINYVQNLGYKEINWNLGCPYPMVVNRCMGSGLINDPVRIDQILQRVHDESDIRVSMKMRMGYHHSEEILQVFPILDKYPLDFIAIHARTGKQLYQGGVDLDSFERCLGQSRHEIIYNGDITSVASFREMNERFPQINRWMIGRGLISDPFLPGMIQCDSLDYPDNRRELFGKFLDTLFDEYSRALSGTSHVLLKMTSYWEYFSQVFDNPAKTLKKIKKAKKLEAYESAVSELLEEF